MATRLPPEYREQFRHIDNLVSFTEQERLLELVASAWSGVRTFLDRCVLVREALLADEGVALFPEEVLNALVGECGRALLCAVPAGSREELLARSNCAEPPLVGLAPEVAPFARAELRLRRLGVLCIETIGEHFRGESRLPQWDRLHDERLAELAAAESAWEAVAARSGIGRVPR